MTTKLITIDAPSLALAEKLRLLQMETNLMEGHHPMQSHTYGALQGTIIEALTCGLVAGTPSPSEMEWKAARGVADDIYMEAIDCGENLQYVIDYLNATWEVEYACPACGFSHEGYCDARVAEHMREQIAADFGVEFSNDWMNDGRGL